MSTPCTHRRLREGYYGHDCADCGELIYPYGCAPWDDGEEDWDQSDDYQGDGWDQSDDYQGDGWDDDEPEFDCGWVRGIGCQLAGTEECDFECPHRDSNYKGLRLTRARLAKRGGDGTK